VVDVIEHVRKTISVRNNSLLVCCGLYTVKHLPTFWRVFMLRSNIPNIYCLTLKALRSPEGGRFRDPPKRRRLHTSLHGVTSLMTLTYYDIRTKKNSEVALTSYWRCIWGCRGMAQVILHHGTIL